MNKRHRIVFLAVLVIVLVIPVINVLLSSFRQPRKHALQLDGVSGNAQVASENLLLPTMTVAFWVYETDSWPTGDFLIGAFFNYGAMENMTGYAMVLTQNGGVKWTVGDGETEYGYLITSGSNVVPPREWTFVVGEYDSNTHMSLLYINGSNLIGTRIECYMLLDNESFMMGSLSNAPPNAPAQLYNVQVYNRRLSVIEVDALYEQGLDGRPVDDTIVSWWVNAEQPQANTLTDLTGKGNDAEITGDFQWVENIPSSQVARISSDISAFYGTFSTVGFFFISGLAWFSLGRKSENWLFLSSTLFLFSAVFSFVCFVESLSIILVFFNVLVGSLVISLGGKFKIERAGRFSFFFFIAKDAPSRFFGFSTFSFFVVAVYVIMLGQTPPFSLIVLTYGSLIALIVSVLVFTLREPTGQQCIT